jgi:nucleotidyltransferase substrate binding protein (TIGR01987 family)
MKAIEISVSNHEKAVTKLSNGIDQAENELDRDGVIQRFEFTFELFWKTLKLVVEYEGFDCKSPRSCIKEAYKRDIIVDGEIYLDMLDDRNLSSHVYDEQTSIEIFERIKQQYLERLKEASEKFKRYVSDEQKQKYESE